MTTASHNRENMNCTLPSLIPGPAAFENWSGKPMLSYSSIRVNSLKRLLPHIAFIFLRISEEILTANPPEIPPVPRSLCDFPGCLSCRTGNG